MRAASRWLAIAFAVAVFGCSSNSTGPGNGNAVSVRDNFYSPAATTIAVGETVTWTWRGASQHSVTFDDGMTSPTQSSGTFQRTFATAGSYAYHCVVHGVAMSGTVT